MGKILSVSHLYNDVLQIISSVSKDSASFEAVQLIYGRTKLDRGTILANGEMILDIQLYNAVISDANRRKNGEPLQYILGEWEFYGLPFTVCEGVLIPRADTETLVDTVLDAIKSISSPQILDLCTGSGCIAVALAHMRPDAKVLAADLYPVPLDIAEKNALRNHTKNVSVIKCDIFKPCVNEKFDIIVSNPPYITTDEMAQLSHEVTHEPHTALFGGTDGLDFYRALAEKWIRFIKPGGKMAVEVGYNQSKAVSNLFSHRLDDIHSIADLNGIERVIIGTFDSK